MIKFLFVAVSVGLLAMLLFRQPALETRPESVRVERARHGAAAPAGAALPGALRMAKLSVSGLNPGSPKASGLMSDPAWRQAFFRP